MTRDIPGCDGYRVSDVGEVWSSMHHGRWTRLKLQKNGRGYLMVRFRGKFRAVHRIVLEAFMGPCPSGMECRHLDGNRLNNRLDNLCWGTRMENLSDKLKHGRLKLDDSDIDMIRKLDSEGLKQEAIARRFGVSGSHVGLILSGKTRTARLQI